MLIKSSCNYIWFWLQIAIIAVSFHTVVHAQNEEVAEKKDINVTFLDEGNNYQYAQYMKEIFEEIENDRNFQNQLSSNNGSASYEDLLKAFTFTSDSVRNKLDEIKRREIDRLNKAEMQLRKIFKKNNKFDRDTKNQIINSMTATDKNHLHTSQNAEFTVGDLHKLMTKIQHDIKMTDQVREYQYRQHEKRKSWRQRKLWEKFKDEKRRKIMEDDWKALREKYSDHQKINEPGSEEQMKEIWQNIDHLDPEYFNSKTFFNLHDLNQDGQWDIEEIEAMIIPGIKKAYSSENKLVDNEEIYHEIMKMRQHFMKRMDGNEDQIVTLEEFDSYSQNTDYKRNDDWKVTEEIDNPILSDEDIKNFEKELEAFRNSTLNLTNPYPTLEET